MTYPGVFISLEGGEGSGKTTQIKLIEKTIKLVYPGTEVTVTREPGSTKIGQLIRSILLHPDNTSICTKTEVLLYMADRVQNLEEIVIPALRRGAIVICDRYIDSTMAYQYYARGGSFNLITTLNQLSTQDLLPDLTLLFDAPVEVGLNRAAKDLLTSKRGIEETRFENEKLEFHNKVRDGYLSAAQLYPDRIKKIDASFSIPEVTLKCMEYIEVCLHKKGINK